MATWRLSYESQVYESQVDVAIGRTIHFTLDLEAKDAWKGALEFSTDIVTRDGEKVFQYVSRKLVFR
jgi:hypothetical protein